jgi:hypothetical protein
LKAHSIPAYECCELNKNILEALHNRSQLHQRRRLGATLASLAKMVAHFFSNLTFELPFFLGPQFMPLLDLHQGLPLERNRTHKEVGSVLFYAQISEEIVIGTLERRSAESTIGTLIGGGYQATSPMPSASVAPCSAASSSAAGATSYKALVAAKDIWR